MKFILITSVFATAIVFPMMPQNAHCQIVGNSGFETPDLAGAPLVGNPPTGPNQPWTFLGRSGISRNTGDGSSFSVAGAVDGQYAYLQRYNGSSSSISQNITFSTLGDYDVSYLEAGRIASNGDLAYSLSLTPNIGGAPILYVYDSTTTNQPFTSASYDFTVATAGDYTLTFSTYLNVGSGNDDVALFDSITVVPEPTTTILGLIGGFGLFARRIRNCRNA